MAEKKVQKKNKDFSSLEKDNKKIDTTFERQNKKFDFRQSEIIEYRKKAKETLKTDLNSRLTKINKENFQEENITKEKKEKRNRLYGEGSLSFKIDRVKNQKGLFFVARNRNTNKIEAKIKFNPKLSDTKHKNLLLKEIKVKGFNYNNVYVKEDSEPIKTTDKRKNVTVSYNTYFRFGIIIYRLHKGKKYEVIYQTSDTQARSVYVSYQRIIAQVKEDVLNNTGIALEEWIYLNKTEKNIFIEGGINYKRFKAVKFKGEAFKSKLDYQFVLNFENL